MSKLNNWFIKNDINYYVKDITAKCEYLDGDGYGDGYYVEDITSECGYP